MQQPTLSNDTFLEQNVEALDQGDAGKPLDSGLAEVVADTEKQKRIQAGFKLLDDARTLAIQHGVVSQIDADNFKLLDDSPECRVIKKAYEDTTQELAYKGDDPDEVIRLKEAQAKLYLQYAYNTLALLQDYKHEMYRLVFRAAAQYNNVSNSFDTPPESSLEKSLNNLAEMGTTIEGIQSNTQALVPEITKEHPNLVPLCVELNAKFLTEEEQGNQLKDSPDQAPKELGRFYENLTKIISVQRIQQIAEWIKSSKGKDEHNAESTNSTELSSTNPDQWSTDATKAPKSSDQASQTDPNSSQFEKTDQTSSSDQELTQEEEEKAEKVLQDA